MKHHTTLVVTVNDDLLKVKRQNVVLTNLHSKGLDDCLEEESLASSFHITASCNDIQALEDAEDAPPELGVKSTVDDLKEINLGTEDNPRPTYISASLTPEEEVAYIELLREYRDVIAWSYKEMPAWLGGVTLEHVSRGENRQADALAKLASAFA
ncbi:hypothetical protein Vadar_021161 [Vaccinium darrowii]|uniref:Uncharacterized protein n=1 Tax=Vaccinium darrowii TaxID=229202 RepID=A0ACB7ZLI9_9ERIC|nr:hypothetical protein Vadar_021161 [Vaccinium darrowii]